MHQARTPLTCLLQAAGNGDAAAASDLLPLVYDELRKLARAYLAKTPPGNTFQATALVHEAYTRLIGNDDPGWQGRRHFFGAAARSMRDILVDQARRKGAMKHGGNRHRIDLSDSGVSSDEPPDQIIALHEALNDLEQTDPRKAELIMLRYFVGLTMEETAAAMNVSLSTIEREWRFTRALLYTQIGGNAE